MFIKKEIYSLSIPGLQQKRTHRKLQCRFGESFPIEEVENFESWV